MKPSFPRRAISATLLGFGLFVIFALTRPTLVARAAGVIGTGTPATCLANLDSNL
ncbi:MAG: hypothetical protein JNL09_03810, partial [Anaerolineales bacterium]|nr:hypothetical protein [Anaerolineales bacterium]